MNQYLCGRIAEELDFYRVRSTISSYAKTEEGKDEVNSVEPGDDIEQIEKLKTFGREWSTYIAAQKKDALTYVPKVKHLFALFNTQGTCLSEEELLHLGQFCSCVMGLKKAVSNCEKELTLPNISELCKDLPDLSKAHQIIFSVIDTDGVMRDLPELTEIRNEILKAQRELEGAIKKYTSDSTLSGCLQAKVPALKSGRQLLAVKSSRRGEIKGIVHELSASGQTVFIEPEEAVRANNSLVQAEFKLKAEIKKILTRTTASLSEYKDDFYASHKTLSFLDHTYASAKWQNVTQGIFAETCKGDTPPRIRGGRHPLLEKKAVPIDINFVSGKTVLIITGANTGGKTVTLKTLALFALLNQAGFSIPAAEGTRLPIFSSVFADIGDEQSIDASLSTFSSHMKNIAFMLEHADEHSLVLLDELATGTDPQEGGAIAMATLDSLIKKRALTLVTTHHGILKQYGATKSECINASVEFDAESMRPTYKLLMGIPGESHALDIAKRSGLSDEVLGQAKKYIDGNEADVSELIKNLSKKHAELDALIQNQKQAGFALEEKKLKLLEKEQDLKEKELILREEEKRSDSAFVRETRSRLENLVRVLREGEITREKTLSVRKFIDEISGEPLQKEKEIEELTKIKQALDEETQRQKETVLENGIKISSRSANSASNKKTKKRLSNSEAFKNASVPQAKEKPKTAKPKPQFVPGAAVILSSTNAKGTLLEEVKNGEWAVQFGSVKMTVAKSALRLTQGPEAVKTTGANVIDSAAEKPKFELRLLGMRSEEALKALEHQIDLCTVNSFKNFSVIHGKGNGILQQAVHDYLSHSAMVKDFSFAPPQDGGTGKTYVELV